MSDIDYTETERPIEPAFANEDPEGWVDVLAWEEARADKLADRVKELEAMLDTILLVLEGKAKFSPDEIDTQNARVILEGNK